MYTYSFAMPTRTPSTRTIQSLSFSTLSRPFICPSCIHKGLIARANARAKAQCLLATYQTSRPLRRQVSSIASVTAVNVTKTIPSANERLYGELKALEKTAATFLSLPQLQLALRGLESEDPIVRVAVISLSGQRGVRRLIRTLLVDPLGQEQPWEKLLEDGNAEDARALLIRSGDEFQLDQRHPLIETLSVPCTLLSTHKIELLVHSIDAGEQGKTKDVELNSQDLLVPALDTPSSASGRSSTITYPVHKTLIYGEGVQGILSMPNAALKEESNNLIRGAINAHWQSETIAPPLEESIALVNLSQAEAAITSFRASLNNSLDYEHKWLASNVASLISFILSGATSESPQTLKPALRSLIFSVLTNASSAISASNSQRIKSFTSSIVPDRTRSSLSEALSEWAEAAHIELRDSLAIAFASPAWRKTAWWKLLWRVDDVGYIAAEIMQRSFLVEAEKEIIWIGGRMQQAGLLPEPEHVEKEMGRTQTLLAHPPPPRLRYIIPLTSSTMTDLYVAAPAGTRTSLPQQIFHARADLLASIVFLQNLAQTLLLQSLSTTVLTSALSALMYVSISTTSIYEAGAIAALGIAWSARRLQRMWERAREEWVGRVIEEGRKALGAVEGEYRRAVEEEGRGKEDGVMESEERRAGEAVRRCREELERMG